MSAIVTAAPSPDGVSGAPSLIGGRWRFVVKHHLPIGLLLAVVIGSQWSAPEQFLSSLPVPINPVCIAVIFFLQGLKLETEEAKDALTSWRASLYGLSFILLLSPLLSLLVNAIDIEPSDLLVGLSLFLTMPSTISTGVIFTREAHGNASLAMLLCVGSTLLGMIVLPFTISNLALKNASVEFDTWAFLLNLLLTVLLPLLVGKAIRELLPNALHYVRRSDNVSKYVSSLCLILLPFLQISKSGDSVRALSLSSILVTLALGSILHLLLLVINMLVCRYGSRVLRVDSGKQKSLILCCSEKTVAIGIAVLPMLDYPSDRKGLLAVSMVISHLVQTVVDSMLAAWWKGKHETLQVNRGGSGQSMELMHRSSDKNSLANDLSAPLMQSENCSEREEVKEASSLSHSHKLLDSSVLAFDSAARVVHSPALSP